MRSTKLRVVADDVLKFARGCSLPDVELEELRRAPARYHACSPAQRATEEVTTDDEQSVT
ncbi:hypothetical protein AB0N87_35550 [Streptomyces sp. NPDC093228]|uniref:hypothetical protein n=1 Tax=Streptomyces sp. NPDC093228 TaxID=3155070 RepID=UPI00074105AB|nr:hypothetical protein ADL25_14930 [Streptomyces sp. NRRL F-5122]